MSVAFADAASITNNDMIQQRSIAVRGRPEPIQIIGKHVGLQSFDANDLRDLLRIPRVVRQRVMRIRNSDLGVRPIRFFAAHHERNHSREIGLEGEDLQIEHQLRMFFEGCRYA